MAESIEDMYDLDVDILITLVEERPVLWDRALKSYKSKTETSAAWREICVRLNPGFDELSEADKNKYGKTLIKRWTNLRDRYIKYLKKVQEQSSTGSKAKTVKKYLYCDQMSFLNKNALKNDPESSLDDTQTETQLVMTDQLYDKTDTTAKNNEPPRSRKRAQTKYTSTEVERTIMNRLQEPEDRHLNFFKGILPSLQLLRDDEVIRFQSGVLNVLQDIHKARQPVVANPHPGYQFQGWNLNYPPPPCYVQNLSSPPPQLSSNSRSTVVGSASNDFRRSELDKLFRRSELDKLSADESPISSESDF